MKLTRIPLPPSSPQDLNLDFILSDCPPVELLDKYASEYADNKVLCIVRVCESEWYDSKEMMSKLYESYMKNTISKDDIKGDDRNIYISIDGYTVLQFVDDVHFEDGGVPSEGLVEIWLDTVERVNRNTRGKCLELLNKANSDVKPALAVHCVSGLGRAPVLVVLAIMHHCPDMDVLDVIAWIRKYRKGALNQVQIKWLEEVYDRKMRKKMRKRKSLAIIGDDGAKKEHKSSIVKRLLSNLI